MRYLFDHYVLPVARTWDPALQQITWMFWVGSIYGTILSLTTSVRSYIMALPYAIVSPLPLFVGIWGATHRKHDLLASIFGNAPIPPWNVPDFSKGDYTPLLWGLGTSIVLMTISYFWLLRIWREMSGYQEEVRFD